MKKGILLTVLVSIIISAMILTACSPNEPAIVEATNVPEEAEPKTIEAQEIEIIQNNAEEFEGNMQGEYLLLDVRTQAEYDSGNIEGATLIPVDELENRLSEIEDYKDKTVLVYCRSGNRSMVAADILVKNGFSKVHNLLGGIGAWNSYKGN